MLGLKFTDPTGNAVAEVALVDRPISVGRATDVDIALPFKAISRYHARFFPHGDELYVEDLGSSNGVLVGGTRIAGPTRLAPGDAVRIGVINVTIVDPAQGLAPGYGQASWQSPPTSVDTAPQHAAPAPADPFQAQRPYQAQSPAHQGQSPAFQPAPPNPFEEPARPDPPTAGRPEWMQAPQQGEGFSVPPGTVPDLAEPPDVDEPSTLEEQRPLADAAPEKSPEAPTMALQVVPRLVGLAGHLKGEVFFIEGRELVVGRVKGAGLVVEDASVSRNHAKIIRREDDTFLLFDLRSFNGTFVNDEKTTKSEIKDGDTVRFGDIAFRFLIAKGDETAALKKRKPSRTRRVVMLGGAAVLLAIVVAAANIISRPEPPPPPPDPAERERALAAKVRQMLEAGESQLRRRDWETASTTLQGVLKIDPLNQSAVTGLEIARVERERNGWLEEAVRISETGRDLGRAQELLGKIPQKSTYYADSRVRLRQVNRVIAEESRNLGLSYCRAWRYEECQQSLCRFFQSWPMGEPIPDEVRVRRALESAEEQLKRRRRDEFVPCVIPVPGTGDQEADAALAEQYPDEKIRRAVVAYTQGHGEDAIKSLASLEKQRQYVEHRETIDRLLQQMLRAETASADCHRDVRAERLEEAERSFEVIEQADTAILPSKIKSRYSKESGHLLGSSYYEQGSTHYRSNQLREAFKSWTRGKRFDPDHPDLLQSLMVLAGRASEACETAKSRAAAGDSAGASSHYELCRDITTPTSELHQLAVEALKQL
jgi:pSer/pThr/pTyr-binding forkhead associated (FHA) protein